MACGRAQAAVHPHARPGTGIVGHQVASRGGAPRERSGLAARAARGLFLLSSFSTLSYRYRLSTFAFRRVVGQNDSRYM